MSTVFNTKAVDFTTQPMFFGEPLNVSRTDVQKYQAFEKVMKKQVSYYWVPEEINISKDISDFRNLEEHEKNIFVKNLKYQTLLDSIQSRGPNLALLPYVSIPELEQAILSWTFFESIHARAYQYVLKNLDSVNITSIFDSIVIDPTILERAKQICFYYDDFIDYAKAYEVLGLGKHTVKGKEIEITEDGLRRKLFLLVVAINALEGVRFYASFACSFAFAANKKMTGNADEIALIARDEFQHLAITQNIIKYWKRKGDDPIMEAIIPTLDEEVYKIYDMVVEQEKAWAKEIFKDGAIVGLNSQLLCDFIEFKANERLRTIGYKPRYETTKNPLLWINKYLNSEGSQPAPQESEIISYVVGAIDMNLKADDFNDFTL